MKWLGARVVLLPCGPRNQAVWIDDDPGKARQHIHKE